MRADEGLRGRAGEGPALPERAARAREIVFVRGTTEAINLVAQTYGRQQRGRGRRGPDLRPGAPLEHRALADAVRGEGRAAARWRPSTTRARSCWTRWSACSSPRTRLVCGRPRLQRAGHRQPGAPHRGAGARPRGARCWWTARRPRPHLPVDVQALDCDFYAFSGHKVYGPSGIGVLYGKRGAAGGHAALAGRRRHDPLRHLREDDLQRTSRTSSRRARPTSPAPSRWARPSTTWTGIGPGAHRRLRARAAAPTARTRLRPVPGLRLIGTAREKAGVLSFVLEGVHPHDIGTVLDYEGIAIRTGHHCAQPVMERFGVPATARASLAALQHAAPSSTRWCRACTRSGRCSRELDLRELYQEMILDHSRQPAELRASCRGARKRGGLQPAVRRPGDRLRRAGRRPARRTSSFVGNGLLHLHRLGLDDDGEPEGQDAGGGGGAVRALPRARHRAARPGAGRAPPRSWASWPCSPGVSEFPVRVKCASLAWHTLKAALAGERTSR